MTDDTFIILMIILTMALTFTACIFWPEIKNALAAVGAIVMWPYNRIKRKRAEKAYFQFIEEHKEEFIEELMKLTRNEMLGQQGDREEKREDEKKEE